MGFQDYEIIEELGSGSYGKVFTVRDRRTGEICVQKVVSLDGVDEKDREETLNEARLMSQCEHFNIIKYLDSFIENNYLCIIMEYASGGDLTKKIKSQQGKPFKEDLLWNFLIQISQGLKYLHDKRILHRDIKPQNIFLDAEDNIKIGDMGLGRILGPQSSFASSNVGTPLYQSPELCQEKPYNHKSDIWAFGCLMYELASFSPPFLATNQIALAKKIVSETPKPLPKNYSMELQFLIFKMLEKEPSKRPDISHVLNYSAVKLRIQKAKLRHKELKLKEQFVLLEKQLRMEYETKIGLLERKVEEYHYQEMQMQKEKEVMRERVQELDKKDHNLRELEEKLLKKENQLNELIKHGHVIISTPNNGPILPTTSPFTSPSKEHGTPQKKLDSKYYKAETTKVVQEKFNNLYNMFHNDSKPISPQIFGRPKSAPSTPVKKREILLMTPSPKPIHRPKSNGTAPLEHTPKQKRKPTPSTPNNANGYQQVSVSSSVQLDSNFVGKVMGKIMQKKQTSETPLGNRGRKQTGGSPDEAVVDRVKKKLMFGEEHEPTLFRPTQKISPTSRHFDFRISEPQIEVEELNSDEDSMMAMAEEDLLVLRRKLKSEEVNK